MEERALFDVPIDVRLGLPAGDGRPAEGLLSGGVEFESTVPQSLAALFAAQVGGEEPDPGVGEIASLPGPCIAVAVLGRHDELPSVPEHLAAEFGPGSFPAAACLGGGFLVNEQAPAHRPALAHPLGMAGGLFVADADNAAGGVFGQVAVSGLDGKGDVAVHVNPFPAVEFMDLDGVGAPGSHLDHQVGGFQFLPSGRRVLPEDGFLAAQRGITEIKFDEEGLLFAGLRVVSGEGMPPPLIAYLVVFVHSIEFLL
ncbi:MAG: hypothetical protein II537_07190 [Bacteroidales bacterium]|nr:hypothetical protein [Bacteroidales bacterium]